MHKIFTFSTKVALIILFFSLFQKTQAQTTSFKGTIKSVETGKGLEDVVVNIDKTNNHTHTDDKGNFFFVNMPTGSYDIEFEKTGYEKQFIKLELKQTDTINLQILLTAKAINLNEISIATDRPVSAASSS